MKLALKFTVSFIVVLCLVFTANAYWRVKRERSLFVEDIRLDQRSLGIHLATAVHQLWDTDGADGVRAFIKTADELRPRTHVGWIAAESLAVRMRDRNLPEATRDSVLRGVGPVAYAFTVGDQEYENSLVPVHLGDSSLGAIELSESFEEEKKYIGNSVYRLFITWVVIIVLTGGISGVLGILLVGRRVNTLISKARRVAGGDFSGPIQIGGADELTELARELNAMSDRLEESKRRLADEVVAHRATSEQLRHANRLSTSGFLSSALAHELGTPLNVVLLKANALASGPANPDEIQSNARSIVEQVNRMGQITRLMLDYTRRRSGIRTVLDLGELCRRVLALASPTAHRSGVALDLRLPSDPVSLVADSIAVQQALMNLVLNGIQAMPGGGTLTLSLERRRDDSGRAAGRQWICLTVEDEGPGIAPEYRGRIFEPFFTTRQAESGSGLGLCIAQHLVKDHNGRIEVDFDRPKGVAFSIVFPEEAG